MKQNKLIILLLAPFMFTGAQAQTELRSKLNQCAGIDNVLERLACYDEISNDDNAATAQPSAPSSTTPVVVRPQSTAPARPAAETAPDVADTTDTVEKIEEAEEIDELDTFGLETESVQARVETTDAGEKELVDTVTEIKLIDPTRVLITLASGQVWRQTVGKRYLLREGDTVRITPSAWGDEYRLSADGKRGFIQVNRAR